MSFHQILSLLWPLLIDQLFLQLINLVNTGMIASYGPEAISAVSIVSALNNFVTNLFVAIATGCAVVVAQYYGRREYRSASEAAAQAVTSSFLITILISTALYLFADPLIALLLGEAEPLTQEYGRTFLIGNAVSFPFFAVTQTVMSALRGSGNTKASVFFSTGLNVANVLGNVLWLNIFPLGVYGLSVAAVASRAIFSVLAVLYLLNPHSSLHASPKSFFTINLSQQRSILFVAVPSALEQIFFHGGRIVTQVFVVGFGTMSTTANAIAMNFNGVLQISGAAISAAIVTIAGQCIGMGNTGEARRYIRLSTFMGSAACALTSLICVPLLHPFLIFYHLPPEAYRLAYVTCIMLLVGTPLTWSVSFVTPSGLRAGGDAVYTSIMSLICMWGVRVGLGYLFGVTLGFGLYGIWAAMFSEWAVRGVIFLARARGDRWCRHKVIQD